MKFLKLKKREGVRVYEIAKSLGIPSSDVIEYLDFIGVRVKSASSLIGFIEAEVVMSRLGELKDDFVPIYAKPVF
jgi:predicted transcriptional regulator